MAFLTPAHMVERLYLQKGNKVADFGTGSGAYALELAHAVTDTGKVYAIDLHRDSLQTLEHVAAKRGFLNIETVWARSRVDNIYRFLFDGCGYYF